MMIFGFMATPSVAEEAYSAPFWLPSGHLQTIYPAVITAKQQVKYRRERWELDDGDFMDVDWLDTENDNAKAIDSESKPTVVLFHGLEGSSKSHYALALMAHLQAKGWRGVVVHFRGCSGENNRLPRAYFAGDSADIEMALTRVKKTVGNAPVYAVGVSLGGNALLKWLGESGEHAAEIIQSAAAVSAPTDLAACGVALDKGLNRLLYTPMFVNSMRPKALEKARQFPGLLDEKKIKSALTIREFDTLVTAKLHGFVDADDYWAKNASKPWLPYIKVPTLILNAKNDPFIPAESLPDQSSVSNSVTLEVTEEGGHVGFISPPFPGNNNWLPQHIIHYFESLQVKSALTGQITDNQ
ncbi:MAG: hydrolase [Methylotenera sp.]|uniref:hydrolase n=1 Tax=Methylotenera sp. TaxID=2051956 RepID=UPI002488E4C3|nr:hydrolase [Methylotenera sp.]MDI1309505.1 hydrolase [Methylotenera sp.]